MENKNLKMLNVQELSEEDLIWHSRFTFWSDQVIRGLVSLAVIFVLIMVLRELLDIPIYFYIIIAFITSIIISPIMSKIKVSDKFVMKYILFINKITYKPKRSDSNNGR